MHVLVEIELRSDLKGAPPLVIDDRALRWKASGQQPSLDILQCLFGEEVQRQPFAALTVSGDRRVVQTQPRGSKPVRAANAHAEQVARGIAKGSLDDVGQRVAASSSAA